MLAGIRYIPDIVRVLNGAIARFRPIAPLLIRAVGVVLALAGLSGCGPHSSNPFAPQVSSHGYWYPLTVGLKFDPSVTNAGVDYTDGCLQRKTLPFGEDLKAAFTKQIGLVFARVKEIPATERASGLDGEVTVSLGYKELELFIARRATKDYQATLSLGGTVAFFNPAGEILYAKNLRYDAHGTVETEKEVCEVEGLAGLANEAAVRLAEGFTKGLGTSVKVRELVQAKEGGGPAPSGTPAGVPAAPPGPPDFPPAASPLMFSVMLRDMNQNQVLEGGERVSLEVEVKNTGPDPVDSVLIVLDGTPELVKELGTPLVVGDLQPGQSKVVKVTGHLPRVETEQEAELMVSVETLGGALAKPVPKKFVASLRPGRSPAPGAGPVDVDTMPRRAPGTRRQAVGLAVGVGTYRDPQVPGRQFATRDAETMAKYFTGVVGIPAQKVKLLTDEQVLKQDLAEAMEEWLPRHVDSGGDVFVFFSGRAVVDPVTGAVSLVPYEGHPEKTARLFSLRRLRAALARLPARHMVLILDVTLTTPADTPGFNGVKPDWFPSATAASRGELVQLVGISGTQDAVDYAAARHGLFTYYLLQGLGGAADRDKDGVVSVSELFDYARHEVSRTAKDTFGLVQEPQAVPVPNPKLKAWSLPVVRLQ